MAGKRTSIVTEQKVVLASGDGVFPAPRLTEATPEACYKFVRTWSRYCSIQSADHAHEENFRVPNVRNYIDAETENLLCRIWDVDPFTSIEAEIMKMLKDNAQLYVEIRKEEILFELSQVNFLPDAPTALGKVIAWVTQLSSIFGDFVFTPETDEKVCKLLMNKMKLLTAIRSFGDHSVSRLCSITSWQKLKKALIEEAVRHATKKEITAGINLDSNEKDFSTEENNASG